jgi:hypothetical protein
MVRLLATSVNEKFSLSYTCSRKPRKAMSTQITITLPDDIYQRAELFARLANRDIASVLADTIQLSIPSVSLNILDLPPVADLPDEQVLALTELQMEPEQDARLSALLDRQQANLITENERLELQALMQLYQEGLLRKATALSEAVKRGLLEPLNQ